MVKDLNMNQYKGQKVIIKGCASAVLAASIFHYGEFTIKQTKEYLKSKNVPVRL